MGPAVRQALAILAAGVALGLGANALRPEPLPWSGSLDPPSAPEPGSDLIASTSGEALSRWEEGAFFLDVRSRDEWMEERVSGSFSVAVGEFDDRYFQVIAGFGTDVPLFVYGAGPDSHEVRRIVAKLHELGHVDVGFLTAGLGDLLAAGLGPAQGPDGSMP